MYPPKWRALTMNGRASYRKVQLFCQMKKVARKATLQNRILFVINLAILRIILLIQEPWIQTLICKKGICLYIYNKLLFL